MLICTDICILVNAGTGMEKKEGEGGGGGGEKEEEAGNEWLGEGGSDVSATSVDSGGEGNEQTGEETWNEEEKEAANVLQRRWIRLYPSDNNPYIVA